MKLPRYPIYVISKGRADRCLTSRFLTKDGVPHKVVVEPQEVEAYSKTVGAENLLVLPFSNLGLGGIPARNWVWEHAKAAGAPRHWILDDNIRRVRRIWRGKRLQCPSGPAFAAVEDFTDRYENVAISGMNYQFFAIASTKGGIPPFYWNVHVYSCCLIRCDLPFRWRGRYNEDTDLCLQVLSANWCTILTNVFVCEKMGTMTMKGGNTSELYKADGRLKMARSLERQWPGVVTVGRRFKRPQHIVYDSWKRFSTLPKLKPEFASAPPPERDEYGLTLIQNQPKPRPQPVAPKRRRKPEAAP